MDLFYFPQGYQLYENSWENLYQNSWDSEFTEKCKHLAATKPVDETATVNCNFLESAQWVLLVDAKDDVSTFNMPNIVSYFIERKAKENESNKGYKNISRKAFSLFRHGNIEQLEIAWDDDEKVHFRYDCLPEMEKTVNYKVKLSLQASSWGFFMGIRIDRNIY